MWKSTDGGLTWDSLFDEQDVLSVGAIAVHPVARETVWVGTGEANPRNSAATGRGGVPKCRRWGELEAHRPAG